MTDDSRVASLPIEREIVYRGLRAIIQFVNGEWRWTFVYYTTNTVVGHAQDIATADRDVRAAMEKVLEQGYIEENEDEIQCE